MPYRGQVTITPPGGAPAPATVEVGEDALTIAPEAGQAFALEFVDIDDLFDDNYTLRLTDADHRRIDLSMFGKGYGEILGEIRRRRDERLQRDLLLTGVSLQDRYPAKLFGGAAPEPVELRVFEDLLVVVPERGVMWGVPYSSIEDVAWDQELYQVRVTTDEGSVHVVGQLAKRSEEFRDELRRLLDHLAARTATALGGLLPGLPAGPVSRLAAVMRDGRAVQQRAVDAIDPALWPALEAAVVGTDELRATYEALAARCPPGWAAIGVKTVTADQDPGDAVAVTGDGEAGAPPELAGAEDAEPSDGGIDTALLDDAAAFRMWFFCPQARDGAPVNAVAHEVTSESGHATYLYRLMEPERFASLGPQDLPDAVSAGIARLNRALLTLNFRREPIFAAEEDITTGRFRRYRTALRLLDHLRFARSAFLGRAIHNATWERQVEEAVGQA